jgi:hypothetical protein
LLESFLLFLKISADYGKSALTLIGLEWKDLITAASIAYNIFQHWLQNRAVETSEKKTLLNAYVENLTSEIDEFIDKATSWHSSTPGAPDTQAKHQNLIHRLHVIGRQIKKISTRFPAFSSTSEKLGRLRDAATGAHAPPNASPTEVCGQIREAGEALLDVIELAQKSELEKLPKRWWIFGGK